MRFYSTHKRALRLSSISREIGLMEIRQTVKPAPDNIMRIVAPSMIDAFLIPSPFIQTEPRNF